MGTLITGLIIFLAIHSVAIVNDAWRRRMIERLGEWPWKALYSVIALAGFLLIIQGYGQARLDPVMLYTPPAWLRHAAMLLLIPVFPLLLAAYLPGRIRDATRHPMLAATKLWAFAHLLANGTLADIVLFGSFLAWAVADRISLKRRAEPSVPLLPHSVANDAIAVVAGLGLYVVFVLWLHIWLIGVAPLG
ncbi:MAG: NnrU family protein [Gammaproteobacteria bacterium]|jgi:uncharacterized membrane protein